MEKTIALTGAEIKVEYGGGANAWLRNDGTSTVYAARTAGIIAGADGVLSIPAGQSAPVYGTNGTVYLLGAGSVQLIGSDYSTNPFDGVSMGGAADTPTGVANLLINPDFKINQRGQDEYTAGYTVDRWKTQERCTFSVLDSGIEVRPSAAIKTNTAALSQIIECPQFLIGEPITFSTDISITNDYAYIQILALDSAGKELSFSRKQKLEEGLNFVTMDSVPKGTATLRVQYTLNAGADTNNAIVAEWAKLEHGKVHTAFFHPECSSELLKCQHYYQIRSTNDIDLVDLRPSMGTITDIKQVTGGYAYVAEL